MTLGETETIKIKLFGRANRVKIFGSI